MRSITKLVWHCSASDRACDDNEERLRLLHCGPSELRIDWGKYKDINCLNWTDIGYQYFILKSGQTIKCRPEWKVGAHCKGHNLDSIGICLSGDTNFTEAQFEAAKRLRKRLQTKYKLKDEESKPHNFFNKAKTCPNFDLAELF